LQSPLFYKVAFCAKACFICLYMQEKEPTEKNLIFLRKNSLVFLLILFLAADMVFSSVIFFPSPKESRSREAQKKTFLQKSSLENPAGKNIPKISEIKGPRIDDEAASIVRVKTNPRRPALPVGIWLFLLVSYVCILIFNLAYGFRRAMKIQWFWEGLLTFLALWAWYALDQGRLNLWYPVHVLKMGILIYAIYLYFFDKKQNRSL
jgi:hypothetical protein